MHLAKPFDPIAPGEWDFFAFDFTPDVGSASISSTSWSCSLKPLQTAADAAPQGHVAASYVQTQLGMDDAAVLFFPTPPAATTVLFGAFSVARVGGFLLGQVGATYLLAATVVTSDGRTLSLSADLPIGQL
jgi:hypothetical protein